MQLSIVLALFFSTIGTTLASQPDKWLHSLEHPTDASEKLGRENRLQSYLKHDFSPLLTPRQEFLGYIGSKYQRLRISLTSVTKNPKASGSYLVTGLSQVGDKNNDFRGTITMTQARAYETMHFGLDDELKTAGIKAQGILVGRFRFEEAPEQPHSGTFEGVMGVYWFVNHDGVIQYDDIEAFSDNYKNNQYIGTWTGHRKGGRRVANWGEYRIPFSGDLDIGAGDFGVNPKYIDQGWRDYPP
jgi:hypothetical protein